MTIDLEGNDTSGQPQKGTGPGGGKFPVSKAKYYVGGALLIALACAIFFS